MCYASNVLWALKTEIKKYHKNRLKNPSSSMERKTKRGQHGSEKIKIKDHESN